MRRNKRRNPNVVKPELHTIVEMANNRTMKELLQAPTEGYGEAIVIPEINANHFEIKTNLLQLVKANSYHGFERENPHTHINNFKRITSTLKFRDVPNDKVVTLAPVKAVEESCVTCGGAHAYYNYPNTDSNQPSVCANQSSTSGTLLSNTILNLMGEIKAITTRSGVAYEGPSIPTPKKKKLSLSELTPTRMTLELADQSITHLKGVTEDVFVKLGKFHFPTDFVVVDFEADPQITLMVNDEAVTFNLNQTTRYSSTYDDLSVNRIDIIDVAREEYAQKILGFSNNSLGGNPTLTFEPILSDSSLSFTPFEGSDFILEEIDAYLKDELISPEIDHADFDLGGIFV
uniref:Reverse transcriptase domain-containing protein n=1 Tax=Tanacetum cinerariifolium TaxID=118510 RepID=A0A699HG53_TANCI|nr:reverse transcriptase domain-containing protein [Tanacetum cinerariifolium]